MKIVEPSYEILYPLTAEDWNRELALIERAGRTAYKSEDKITDGSAGKFCQMLIGRKHEAVLEFGNMVVKFITDRGVTHEIVRHRLCSFVQESTRYCNYSDDKFGNDCTFIRPSGINKGTLEEAEWLQVCVTAEHQYFDLLNTTVPQVARSVLPNSLKAEIVVKANFREWRHIFQLRAISKAAHPDMRALMCPLYREVRYTLPEVFEMGDVE